MICPHASANPFLCLLCYFDRVHESLLRTRPRMVETVILSPSAQELIGPLRRPLDGLRSID